MKFEARVAVWSHVVLSERKLGQMIQRSTPERRFKGCRHSNTQQIELCVGEVRGQNCITDRHISHCLMDDLTHSTSLD